MQCNKKKQQQQPTLMKYISEQLLRIHDMVRFCTSYLKEMQMDGLHCYVCLYTDVLQRLGTAFTAGPNSSRRDKMLGYLLIEQANS